MKKGMFKGVKAASKSAGAMVTVAGRKKKRKPAPMPKPGAKDPDAATEGSEPADDEDSE